MHIEITHENIKLIVTFQKLHSENTAEAGTSHCRVACKVGSLVGLLL